MAVRNTLLTIAKAKKFNQDDFLEKVENISGLSEKQWKDNCRALVEKIITIIKGRNISVGLHISNYESIIADISKKFNLTKEQKKRYKKELDRLKKEQKNVPSIEEAKSLLIAEDYHIRKDNEILSTDILINTLKDRINKMNDYDKKQTIAKLSALIK